MTAARRLIDLTEEDLRRIVREEAASIARGAADSPGEWMTPEAAAELIGVKRSYISELTRRHGLPVHKHGRVMRFKRAQVLEWMERRGSR